MPQCIIGVQRYIFLLERSNNTANNLWIFNQTSVSQALFAADFVQKLKKWPNNVVILHEKRSWHENIYYFCISNHRICTQQATSSTKTSPR